MRLFFLLVLSPFISFANKDYEFQYYDNFNTSTLSQNAYNYGLNTDIHQRQLYLNGGFDNAWTRVSGDWRSNTPPPPWYSQVNHPNTLNRNNLSFHLNNSAIRLNYSLEAGYNNSYNVSFIADPIQNDTSSGNWVSFILDDNEQARGWIADPTTKFGLLIQSNGGIQILERGIYHSNCNSITADKYTVNINITSKKYTIFVNNKLICSGNLNYILPNYVHAYIGAYISNSGVSNVDDLIIKTQVNPVKNLTKYGYYFSEGNPFGEGTPNGTLVAKKFTNFNHVKGIDSLGDGYTAYKKCFPQKCILDIPFTYQGYSGYELNELLNQNAYNHIKYRDLFEALYVYDEPYLYNTMSNEEIRDRLVDLKRYTNMKTMFVLSTPGLIGGYIDASIIAPYIDYIGVDEYNNKNNYLGRLDYLIDQLKINFPKNKYPNLKYFIVPAATTCLYSGAETTDQGLAQITWGFHNFAVKNDISAILAFTPWYRWPAGSGELSNIDYCTNGGYNNNNPTYNKMTYEVMKVLGNSILND